MIRAFVATEIPPFEPLAQLLSRLRNSGARISVPRSEGIHVTLKFLGDIRDESVAEILGNLAESVSKIAPFEARVSGTGAFPNRRNPRVLWVGLEDNGMLGRIAMSVDECLSKLGFPKENRPFTPHITVARVKSGTGIESAVRLIEESEGMEFGSFQVKDIRLKKSTLTPTGAIYEDLGVVSLGKDAASGA